MASRVIELAKGSGLVVVLALTGLIAAGCGEDPPDGECRTDADCPDSTVCEPGLGGEGTVCVPGCHVDSQCAANERCELVVCVTTPCPGQCVAAGCETDADCDSGEVCEPSGPGCGPLECVPGCHEDSQCAPGQVCEIVQCVTCPCPGRCS